MTRVHPKPRPYVSRQCVGCPALNLRDWAIHARHRLPDQGLKHGPTHPHNSLTQGLEQGAPGDHSGRHLKACQPYATITLEAERRYDDILSASWDHQALQTIEGPVNSDAEQHSKFF